jgi:hypothetical protein
MVYTSTLCSDTTRLAGSEIGNVARAGKPRERDWKSSPHAVVHIVTCRLRWAGWSPDFSRLLPDFSGCVACLVLQLRQRILLAHHLPSRHDLHPSQVSYELSTVDTAKKARPDRSTALESFASSRLPTHKHATTYLLSLAHTTPLSPRHGPPLPPSTPPPKCPPPTPPQIAPPPREPCPRSASTANATSA